MNHPIRQSLKLCGISLALTLSLTACQKSQDKAQSHLNTPGMTSTHKIMPTHKFARVHISRRRLPDFNKAFLLVIDSDNANISATSSNTATLTIPVHTISQIGHLYLNIHNDKPSYYLGRAAQNIWTAASHSNFAGGHAILAANNMTPISVVIAGEHVSNQNVIFNLNTKPHAVKNARLQSVIFNINQRF